MKRIKKINWKAVTVGFLVAVLAFTAWHYLQNKTNQAHTLQKLESKQVELTNKIKELDSSKLNAQQIEEQRKALEIQSQDLQRQLQSKRQAAIVYAASINVPTERADLMHQAGIAQSDYLYVNYIIGHESSWNPHDRGSMTPLGQACGLPQALPCSKLPCSIEDQVCQLKWASDYARERYGGWYQSYVFWVQHSWW